MSANSEFNKALKLLDFDKIEKGENCLRKAIKLAEEENDNYTLISALCAYGDFLCSTGKEEEAEPYLNRVINYRPGENDDVFDYEINRAKELLSNIS